VVQIHFDTATYDEIERDVKVTMEAELGLIGGNMGLFCGLSIFSMVEIVYYASSFFLSLRTSSSECQDEQEEDEKSRKELNSKAEDSNDNHDEK